MAFKGDDSTLSLATTVTLALAVAAMVFVKNPLQSSRPPGSGTGLQKATGELKVPARLWEDPFAAVEKAVEAQKQIAVQIVADGKKLGLVTATVAQQQGNDGLKSLYDKIKEEETPDQAILTLVVMTQGGSSVESGEVRIRDRYAVGAGLEVGCFAPEKGESLSYFTWDFPEKTDHRTPLEYTPYEWYSRNAITTCGKLGDSIRRVLVLWVKSPETDDKILARLGALLERVHPPDWKQKGKSLRVKLLGPRSSSEFRNILEEIESDLSRTPKVQHRWRAADGRVEVYSPWATAMPQLLSYGLKPFSGQRCNSTTDNHQVHEQLLRAACLIPSYRVTSDNVLLTSLLDELERRQVKVGKDRIVLIGEWDSFYARALPLTFTAAACQHVTTKSKESLKTPCLNIQAGIENLLHGSLSPKDLNISQYSYLSGLDGETAEDQAKRTKAKEEDKAKDRDKGEAKGLFRDIGSYERPEGQAQLDYVRRLVTRIKADCEDTPKKNEDNGEKNQEQKRKDNERNGKVKAIGILGRDPYDALLILQALREEFPNALFFATDLDARYFHEDEQKWTRNLIVASQFGLQLEPSLQRSIPPFRSSLQTSTFFAVLQAIGRVKLGESENKPKFILHRQDPAHGFTTDIPPRLFEIGRHGAVDLSLDWPGAGLPTIHPVRTDVDRDTGRFDPPPSIGLLWIVGLTLGFLALWGYGRLWNWMTARDEPDPAKRRLIGIPRSSWVAVPVAMAMVFTCQIVHLQTYTGEEPFSWTDGVSIWPTEALRFLAVCLCLFFLLKARADSVYNMDEITQAFSPHLSPQPTGLGWRDKLKGFWSDLDWMFHGSTQNHPGPASDLWTRYCRAHEWPPRGGRIALGLLAYLSLLLPLVWVMNDGEFRLHVPCRGTFSCRVDHMFVAASVLSFLFLNLATLDAVILCTKWIQELPSAATQMNSMEKIRLIVERSTVVNRRILHPFIILFLLIGARSHYFDNWDFPPVLILALTVNSLVAIASASLLYLTAVGAKRRILAPLQQQLNQAAASAHQAGSADQRSLDEAVRLLIKEIDGIQQGAFVPFYQQPMVQATLVAALAFLQYWYLGQ
jgi:hypothetical protein